MARPTFKQRRNQHDREMAAIRKLVRTGMNMLAQLDKAQRRTERTLERFIRSLERDPVKRCQRARRQ